MKIEAGVFAALVLALAAACAVQPEVKPAADAQERPRYLTQATTPDAYAIIPPAPTMGDHRNTADWAVFNMTRAIKVMNPARWELAQKDDSYQPADLLADFSCAVGAELTVDNAKTVAKLMRYVGADAAVAAERAKNIYKRDRPFKHNAGDICLAEPPGGYDYPSGHSSASWVEGLVLAELVPDRATQVLQRARAYGESRIVCGVHNWSAVEAGRTNGASVFAVLHGSEEFRRDMVEAGKEIAAARKAGAPDAARCAAEDALTKPLTW